MKTIREYADEKQLTYEAIRRQVDRHQEELKDHLIKKKEGKKTVRYLDEEGEMILNRIRGDNAMVSIQAGKTKELEDLRQENQILKDNIRELQATIIKDHEMYMDLQTKYIGLLEAPKEAQGPAAEPAQEPVSEPVKTEEAPAPQEGTQDAPGSTEDGRADNSTPSTDEALQGPQEAPAKKQNRFARAWKELWK